MKIQSSVNTTILKNQKKSVCYFTCDKQNYDTLDFTNKPNINPNFKSLFGMFAKKEKNAVAQVAGDYAKNGVSLTDFTAVLSAKQLRKTKENVTNEIFSLLNTSYSPANAKRLDKLINSPFVDYDIGIWIKDHYTSLAEIALFRRRTTENKLYNRFLMHSLAKTMPFDNVENEYKEGLYHNNHAILQIFKSYLKMDEKSEDAKLVKDMITRMKNLGVNITDYPSFFADCIFNGKIEMCKFLKSTFNFSPETKLKIVKSDENTINGLINDYGASSRKTIIDDNKSYYSNQKNQLLVTYYQK